MSIAQSTKQVESIPEMRFSQQAFDGMPCAVVLIDLSHNVELISSKYEDFFGVQRHKYIGKPLHRLVGNIAYRKIQPLLVQVLDGQKVVLERDMPSAGHQVRFMRVTYQPMYTSTGEIGSIQIIGEDITKEHVQNLNLRKDKQYLERFAHLASHDLKTAIRNVSIYTGLMERQMSADEQSVYQSYLSEIKDNCHKTYELIETALELNNFIDHEVQLMRFDSNALVDELASFFEYQEQDHQVVIKRTLLPSIYGDRALLKRLFYELITYTCCNSSAYKPEVFIQGHKNEEGVEFSVLVREAQSESETVSTFQPLSTLPTNSRACCNIAFATSQRLVELHGGNIWCETGESADKYIKFQIPIRHTNVIG